MTLNAAAQLSYDTIMAHLKENQKTLQDIKTELSENIDSLKGTLEKMVVEMKQMKVQLELTRQQLAHCVGRNNDATVHGANNNVARPENMAQHDIMPITTTEPDTNTNPVVGTRQLLENTTAQLRNQPLAPTIPQKLPNTMQEILLQHQLYTLGRFERENKTHWSDADRQQLSKRIYLYKQIKERAKNICGKTLHECLQKGAAALDNERVSLKMKTMMKFYNYLKGCNPTTRKRKRV